VLIALRTLQAAGGAGFTPSATGIIVDHFGNARDRAVSLFGSVFSIGAMIGPIFGGLFVTYWSWRGVFFVNVPIGLIVLVLGLHYIPRDRPQAAKARRGMDATGMAFLGTGLVAGMLAASALGERNAQIWSAAFIASLAVSIVALSAFVRHIGRVAQPLIAPRFIHGPGFSTVNLFNILYGSITNGAMALVPLYATDRYGIGALAAGSLLIAQGGAAIVLSIAATFALRRTGYRLPLYVGGAFMALGTLLLALPPPGGITPYLWLTGAASLIGIGSGIVNPASRNAGVTARTGDAGRASLDGPADRSDDRRLGRHRDDRRRRRSGRCPGVGLRLGGRSSDRRHAARRPYTRASRRMVIERSTNHTDSGFQGRQTNGNQLKTRPPSTIRFCPVTARAHGLAKNSTASASSRGVTTRRNGVCAAIKSKMASGVAALASVVRSRPPETMLTVMPDGPSSVAAVRVKDSSAALAAV
jgi:hypothetical protein